MLFKMVKNHTEFSKFEKSFVLKSLVAEKCQSFDLYRRICDVYGEVCFNKEKCLQIS